MRGSLRLTFTCEVCGRSRHRFSGPVEDLAEALPKVYQKHWEDLVIEGWTNESRMICTQCSQKAERELH